MSWLRSAVYRAVGAGGRNNLTRIRSYASVVQQAGNAVAERAKFIQDRIQGARNLTSFRQTVKRLEDVSVSSKGVERVQLLRRWLVALKEVERLSEPSSLDVSDDNSNFDEAKDSLTQPTLVYYVDPESGNEPMNFRDVFLHSQALEGMTLSMILVAPNEEEVLLLLEIFGLCLAGGKEVHKAVMSSIQDLARAFSGYEDEVLTKREELLQYAQAAMSGLKIHAKFPRIDNEARILMEQFDKVKPINQFLNEGDQSLEETPAASVEEDLKVVLEQIWICSKLEELLLKKKSLSSGDSSEVQSKKVHKLKVLTESLTHSTVQDEKRILYHRAQKEDALSFRMAKSDEVIQLEKDLTAEVNELERRKKELEAELKQVTATLSTTRLRLRNAKEEREQFDDASNQILIHLKAKELDLSKSIDSYKKEAGVVDTWIKFLEDAYTLQTTFSEEKDKQINGHLQKFGDYFVNLVIHLLSAYKEDLKNSISGIKKVVTKLLSSEGLERTSRIDREKRKGTEEEYLNLEAKFLTTIGIVDTMRNQFYAQNDAVYRKENEKAKELFDALNKLKEEFESIEKPVFEVDSPTSKSVSPPPVKQYSPPPKHNQEKSYPSSYPQPKLESLGFESEENSRSSSNEDITDWECDLVLREPQPNC